MRAVLRTRVPEEQVAAWKGRHPLPEHYDIKVTGECDLYAPSGAPLLFVRRGRLAAEALEQARPTLHWMRRFVSDNRTDYAGGIVSKRVNSDGTVAKQNAAFDEQGNKLEVRSAIAGFFEPQGGRHPFCRQTAFLRNHPAEWESLQPLLRNVGELYRDTVPLRWKAQMGTVAKVDPSWVIPGTPFTTITVNNSVPAAYHRDGGDLKEGFGVMVVCSKGQFDSFELVVPEYRVATHLRDGDVLFFDPTVWHGNVPPSNAVGEQDEDWYRISLVCYFREGIIGCRSPQDELEKAKGRGAL
jgi:hypothetical protein